MLDHKIDKPILTIYTAIFGDYDKLREPLENEISSVQLDDVMKIKLPAGRLRFVCYTDNINLKSDIEETIIKIEDDGEGFPKDIIHKIGEPYLKSMAESNSKMGMGLGVFIGKTLLEKNLATISCKNSKTRSGAEITIVWKNKDLNSFNLS